MLRAVATFSVRHRWLMLVLWLVLVAGAALARAQFGGTFSDDLSIPGTDSDQAYETLHEKFPEQSGDAMQVVIRSTGDVREDSTRQAVEAALRDTAAGPDVARTVSPYQPGGLISPDGDAAVAVVWFTERARDIPPESVAAAQRGMAPVRDAETQVEFGGAAVQGEHGPSGTEVVGLVAAVIVLLFTFGSVFAMLVPLLTAVLAIAFGLSLISLLSAATPIGTAAPVVAAMIGLGVGIDYALLVVTRHREEVSAGRSATEATVVAMSTAGRSVLVAGSTVVVAILSLYAIGIPFVATLGLASAITVTAALLAAMTLLPALLAVSGDRLDRFKVRRIRPLATTDGATRWHRWARHVQRRPLAHLLISLIVLAAIAIPLTTLRLGTADAGANPDGDTTRRAYDIVTTEFGPGWTGPLSVTVEHPDAAERTRTGATRLRAAITDTSGVHAVSAPRVNEAGDTAVLTVVPAGSPQDESTEDLVHRLRTDVIPRHAAEGSRVHVGGQTALGIDLADRLGQRLPWFIGLVVGLGMLLLLIEFRSLFVPVKAAVLNLLSIGAAYGAVVAAFQWGWLPGTQPGPVESFAPVMLFAVLFGLSMDYEVFLLSRVRERYLATKDPDRAMADGIAGTARVITAAAAVMVVVFASFQLNDQRVVNLFGFGLAVAVALDATIVRLVTVPAAMALAGRTAWWFPRRPPRRATRDDPFT